MSNEAATFGVLVGVGLVGIGLIQAFTGGFVPGLITGAIGIIPIAVWLGDLVASPPIRRASLVSEPSGTVQFAFDDDELAFFRKEQEQEEAILVADDASDESSIVEDSIDFRFANLDLRGLGGRE